MVRVNGKAEAVDGKTIEEYLSETEYNSLRVAVERNGEIVPKSAYGKVKLSDGDVIEIVNFVGGG